MNAVLPFAPPHAGTGRALDTRSDRTNSSAERLIVVFDLDGTLVDTAPDLAASLNHCLTLADLKPVTLDEVRPHAGHGASAMLTEAYRAAGRSITAAELDRQTACFLAYYEDHIAGSSRLFPGALGALTRLQAEGAILAVCTNKTEHLARALLSELGLTTRFTAICGADSFAARKPDPVHLLGTVALAGGEIAKAVMIGDTQTDVEAALRIAIPSILVDFGYDPTASARERATTTISHFDQLDAALVSSLLVSSPVRAAGGALSAAVAADHRVR